MDFLALETHIACLEVLNFSSDAVTTVVFFLCNLGHKQRIGRDENADGRMLAER